MNRPLKIAVADDEAFIRRYFQETLAAMGHEVVAAAEDGRQLVAACAADDVDLVITDIRMPEMDGIAAALEITLRRPTPIVLVSAFHDEDLIARAAGLGAMAYLIKPIQRADLETVIPLVRRQFEQVEGLAAEAERLRQSLEDRKLIERAKGLLMQAAGLTEEEAFRRMQKMACDQNLKLAEVARLIIAAGPKLQEWRKR